MAARVGAMTKSKRHCGGTRMREKRCGRLLRWVPALEALTLFGSGEAAASVSVDVAAAINDNAGGLAAKLPVHARPVQSFARRPKGILPLLNDEDSVSNNGLLITTLDGKVHGLDQHGNLAWVHSLGAPLVDVSTSETSASGGLVSGAPRLLPGLDGTLFLSREGQLEYTMASIREVVDASPVEVHAIPNAYLTGERRSRVHTIELPTCASATDQVTVIPDLHSMGTDPSARPPSAWNVDAPAQNPPRLSFATTRWSVSAVDDINHAELWNMSFLEVSRLASQPVPLDMVERWRGRVSIEGRSLKLQLPDSRCDGGLCHRGGLLGEESSEGMATPSERTFNFDSEVLAAFVFSSPQNTSGLCGLEVVARAAPAVAPDIARFAAGVDGRAVEPPSLLLLTSVPGPPQVPPTLWHSRGLGFEDHKRSTIPPKSRFRGAGAVALVGLAAMAAMGARGLWESSYRPQIMVDQAASAGIVSEVDLAADDVPVSPSLASVALEEVDEVAEVSCPCPGDAASAREEVSPVEFLSTSVPEGSPLSKSLQNGHFGSTFEDPELLGVGGFGAVYRAKHRLEGGMYAVKLIPIEGLDASESVQERRDFREVLNLRELANNSRHVVRYITCWCEEPHCLDDGKGVRLFGDRCATTEHGGNDVACEDDGRSGRGAGHGDGAVASSGAFPAATAGKLLSSGIAGASNLIGGAMASDLSGRFRAGAGSAMQWLSRGGVFRGGGTSWWSSTRRSNSWGGSSNSADAYQPSGSVDSGGVIFEDDIGADQPSPHNDECTSLVPNKSDSATSAVRQEAATNGKDGAAVHGPSDEATAPTNVAEVVSHRSFNGDTMATDPVGPRRFQTVLLIQMELCAGPTLRSWMDARPSHDGVFTFVIGSKGEALELTFAKHLMKGIREIHAAGMVHRDVKPQNLFVTTDEVLKVGDFGLACRVTDDDEKGKVGTPAYCAPEGGARAASPADIFSASLVILELLCPTFSTGMERACVFEAFRERTELPQHIETRLPNHAALLRRMAHRDPAKRPTAAEVHAELKGLGAKAGARTT
eukprot:TRINITY_DN16112_c0_g1_i1.p1 TRINITY_DN16112_c0_g1~~TRINITY_DN16112_c0_g1_i1.p1  ORF type:complete len:1073 (-),score=162.04 TRINITY_DN16112_c0_g1_i1:193-3333(-)